MLIALIMFVHVAFANLLHSAILQEQKEFSADHFHMELRMLADENVRDGIKCAIMQELFDFAKLGI